MPVSHVCAVIVVVAVTWSVCAHLSARRDVSFTCCVHGHPIAVERLALPCDMCAEHDVCCCGVRGGVSGGRGWYELRVSVVLHVPLYNERRVCPTKKSLSFTGATDGTKRTAKLLVHALPPPALPPSVI